MRRCALRVQVSTAAATVALVLAACGTDEAEPSVASGGASATATSEEPLGALAATDGRDTTMRWSVEVGGNPCGVVAVDDAVWVSVNDTAELVRIDPATGEETARIGLSDSPCEITPADGMLWVATQSGVVDRVDPNGPELVSSVPTGLASYQAVAAFDSIWVTNRSAQTITRIDPETEDTTTVDVTGTNAGGIVAAAGALWVGDDRTGSDAILRLDPTTLEGTPVVVGGDRPAYLTVAGDSVWVSRVRSGSVVRVDAASGERVGDPVPAGASPVNLHADPDGRWVWVPDDRTDYLTRIDAGTGQAVERVKAGAGPAVVAPTDTGVWVTNFGDGTVWYLETAPG
jgi:virginiamycin B lyase